MMTPRLNRLTLVTLVLAMMGLALFGASVFAKFAASGPGGCGNFADAVQQAVNGDIVIPMRGGGNNRSDNVLIAKNITVQGGWVPDFASGASGCDNENQTFDTPTDLETAGFIFDPTDPSPLRSEIGSVIRIDHSGVISLLNLLLEGSSAAGVDVGGAVTAVMRNSSLLQLDHVIIDNNAATTAGGGLHMELRGGSRLTIFNSQFDGNTAGSSSNAGHGGGFDITIQDGGILVIDATTVNGNKATTGGGGRIQVLNSGYITIKNSTFTNNTLWANSPNKNSGGLLIESVGYGPVYVCLENNVFANNGSGNP